MAAVNERGWPRIAVNPATARGAVGGIGERVVGGRRAGDDGLECTGVEEVPRAFVHYSDRARATRVSELTAHQGRNAPPTLDGGREKVCCASSSRPNHNGGQHDFGPDGFLYW